MRFAWIALGSFVSLACGSSESDVDDSNDSGSGGESSNETASGGDSNDSSGGSGGGGDASKGSGGNSGMESETVYATEGDDCPEVRLRACSNGAVEAGLFCRVEGQWTLEQTCAEGEVCTALLAEDADGAVLQGQCRAPQEQCVELGPGGRFCSENGREIFECSADLTKTYSAGSCVETGCSADFSPS